MTTPVTRLAPSPTGTLHLGNARTFVINWALARRHGWRIVMRIEDLDATRVRPGAAAEALECLRWLGIDWDEGPVFQSHDLEPYRAAMRTLADLRIAYACSLSRAEMQNASSAPHRDDTEKRAATALRPTDPKAFIFRNDRSNYRFVVPDERISIDDKIAGRSEHHPFNEVGDFAIWTKLGVPAYQLAVVVDDARQGVTDVVRGDDLLPSAARQEILYRALKLKPPTWWHVPLVVGSDGRRLAKRHGDTHVATYRKAGVEPQRVIGLLAFWSGVTAERREISAAEFRKGFDVDRLSREQVVFSEDDHEWLMQ